MTTSASSSGLPATPATIFLRSLLVERRPTPASMRAETQRVLDRLDDDQGDLALSLLWLGQAAEGEAPSAQCVPAVRTLHAYLRDLGDVKTAADAVLTAAKASLGNAPIGSLFASDAPLVAYLGGLYEWCEQLAFAFEEMARNVRRDEPIWPVYKYRSINRGFGRFDDLTSKIHDAVARLRATHSADAGHDESLRALDHRIEELFWAASWLHLSLTRRFG